MLFHQGFFKCFNVEENTTVKNKLLKATNPKCVRENSTIDLTFTADEVSKCIAKLKNKKASSNDSISNEMIKTDSPTILPFLVRFFNTIRETKSYPENWSCRIVTPINKLVGGGGGGGGGRRATMTTLITAEVVCQ